jgi:hypothetical protein
MCVDEAGFAAIFVPYHANCCHDCSSKSLDKVSWKYINQLGKMLHF